MSQPALAARVKESNDLARLRVTAREIRTFPFIAPMAGEREVAGIIRTSMHFGDDVLDMEAVATMCSIWKR